MWQPNQEVARKQSQTPVAHQTNDGGQAKRSVPVGAEQYREQDKYCWLIFKVTVV